jgi:hypothetical protein
MRRPGGKLAEEHAMRADVIVVSPCPTDGERFAVLRRDAIEDVMFAGSLPWRPFAEWQQAFEAFGRNLEWLTEDDIRAQLAGMGFGADEVEQQLTRARSIRDVKMETTWERTTTIGFRNAHRQEVIRKTDLPGVAPGQRVYVLRCGDCGHEHRSDGCDVHARRCPRCQ